MHGYAFVHSVGWRITRAGVACADIQDNVLSRRKETVTISGRSRGGTQQERPKGRIEAQEDGAERLPPRNTWTFHIHEGGQWFPLYKNLHP